MSGVPPIIANPHIQVSMNTLGNNDACVGSPGSEKAGQIVAVYHPDIKYGPGKWSVVTVGDGTPDRDTAIHGLFWTEEQAGMFASAMRTKKGNTPDGAWLTKVSDEAAQRMREWPPFIVPKRGT